MKANVGIYELDLGIIITDSYDFSARILFEFAQKRQAGLNDGFALKMPTISFAWPQYKIDGGILSESGRFLAGEFDEFYYSRRSYLKHDAAAAPVDTLLSFNTALSKKRVSNSAFLTIGANPIKGVDVNLGCSYAFHTKNVFVTWDSTAGSSAKSPNDFSFDLRFSMNDELFSYVKYGSLYIRQHRGFLFPRTGDFLTSWNTEAGFDCMTQPLYRDLSFEAGGRLFYLDREPHPNDAVDPGDRVMEFFASVIWGFL